MHTQDYEKIWDKYSDEFGKKPRTKDFEHLGDEWGTSDLPQKNFDEYVVPHLAGVNDIGELGVGGGKYSILAAQHAQKLYGIDISDNMLARAAERVKESKCEFVPVKCKDSKVNLADASLDLFFSFDSMVHIFPYELFSYVNEIARILKKGAVAVLEFADWDTSRAIVKFKKDYDFFMQNNRLNPGAFGFISRNAMVFFAESAGLEIISIQEISPRTSVVTMRKNA